MTPESSRMSCPTVIDAVVIPVISVEPAATVPLLLLITALKLVTAVVVIPDRI